MSLIEMLEVLRAGLAGLFWLGFAAFLFGCIILCVLPVLFS